MASMCIFYSVFLMIAVHIPLVMMADNQDIGVCYGMLGDDLPSPAEVVSLYKQYGIGKMRLYEPNADALEALRGSNIEVTLGVRNEDVQNIASSQDAAKSWFVTNMQPYVDDISFLFLVVGNEIIPGDIADFIAPAIQNFLGVLNSNNLQGVRVTTAVSQSVLQNSYPPSASEFQAEATGPLTDILKVLSGQGASVLMINAYPYFAYSGDPGHVSLQFAQFTAVTPAYTDGNLEYYNLFSSIVDSFYWAMEKAGATDVGVAVSESGWPSAGNGNFTTPELASVYNKNFVKQIVSMAGTPKRPNTYIDAFIFAMFNENQKPAGEEQNWGLFYPNKRPVYPVFSTN